MIDLLMEMRVGGAAISSRDSISGREAIQDGPSFRRLSLGSLVRRIESARGLRLMDFRPAAPRNSLERETDGNFRDASNQIHSGQPLRPGFRIPRPPTLRPIFYRRYRNDFSLGSTSVSVLFSSSALQSPHSRDVPSSNGLHLVMRRI